MWRARWEWWPNEEMHVSAIQPEIPSPLAGEGGARAEGVGGRGGRLLPHARRMRRNPTEAESRLWKILRGKRLDGFKFKRQQPLGGYIVDFVNFECRVIIEADGSQHAESVQDEVRDSWLSDQGFRVLRFWNSDILARSDEVANAILHALLDVSPPLPNPSPARGEGLIPRPVDDRA